MQRKFNFISSKIFDLTETNLDSLTKEIYNYIDKVLPEVNDTIILMGKFYMKKDNKYHTIEDSTPINTKKDLLEWSSKPAEWIYKELESYGHDVKDLTFFILEIKELNYLPETKNSLIKGFIKKYNQFYKFRLGFKKKEIKNEDLKLEWGMNFFEVKNIKNKAILRTSFNLENHRLKSMIRKHNKTELKMEYEWDKENIRIFNLTKKLSEKFLKPLNKQPISSYDIIVIDIETFLVDELKTRKSYVQTPHACGYSDGNDVQMFYKTDNNNPVRAALENMFLNCKNGSTVYAHNMDKFDSVYIIKELINLDCSISFIGRENSVLGFTATYTNNIEETGVKKFKTKTFKFRDSYKILPLSLNNLAKAFDLKQEKGNYPYEFVTEENLDYVGNVSDKKYFNKISDEEYKILKESVYNLKEETLKYLRGDLEILYNIMHKFYSIMDNEFELNIKTNCSISGIALKLYRTIYYKNVFEKSPIPIIEDKDNEIMREGYHGGIVNIFKPILNNTGYYYDVNSFYPFVMLKDLPVGMPEKSNFEKDIEEIFGIVKAKVSVPFDYYPFLAYKNINHGLIQPYGEWTGWFTSEELKYAKTLGVQIKVLEYYNFKRGKLFNEYITNFYEKKATSSGSLKLIYKFFLNSLYGIFGLRPDSTQIVLLDKKEINKINKLKESFPINFEINCGYKSLISFNYKPTNEAQLNYNILPLEKESLVTNVPIAAMITSYARIHMHKLIKDVERDGGNVYYTDTDSIVTDIELSEEKLGEEIGLLKNEFPGEEITEGLFVLPKTYGIKFKSGKEILKSKGVSNFSFADLRALYNETVKKERSRETEMITPIEFKSTYINLTLKNFKRKRVLNSENKWVDTRPYNVSEIKKNVV